MLNARSRVVLVTLGMVLAGFLPRQAAGYYLEQFGQGNAGWQAVTMNLWGGTGMSPAGHGSTTPGQTGFVTAAVGHVWDRLFGMQPADTALYGPLTGQTLQTDYQINGLVTGPWAPMVRFYVGNSSGGSSDYFVTSEAYSWNPNTAPGWTHHSVPLVAGNFIEWPNQAAHSRSFEQVIAAPDDIGLVFTGPAALLGSSWFLGFRSLFGATISLTNFGTIGPRTVLPEPGTVLLLGLGACAIRRRRRG